jgi:GT2 family glycosyltransferase
MTVKPLFSILLTTHGKPEQLEALLDTLLGFELTGSEIIIVNDHADRTHTRALQLLLDMYPNNNTQYIEHEIAHGRSQSLNKALVLSTGSLIWAPLKADRLNKNLLLDCIRRMADEPASFWVLDRNLPNNIHDWLTEAEEGTLPDDNRFIFNRSFIPPKQLFFREDLHHKPAVELAYRVMRNNAYHQTDSFFIIDKTATRPPDAGDVQEFLFTMLRKTDLEEERRILVDRLKKLNFTGEAEEEYELSRLDEARALIGRDARTALEIVNSYLKKNPNHYEASVLKVTLLEKLRRHVEASELKHSIHKRQSAREKNAPAESGQPTLFAADNPSGATSGKTVRNKPDYSIIIATTGDGKPILEQCLVRLDEIFTTANAELIIIDNASIDDTFDYLSQLQQEQFLNIRVITNSQNAGFAASMNQGMDAANGKYLLLMHNDLFLHDGAIEEMTHLLDTNPYLGAVGPIVDQCDVIEQTSDAFEPGEDFRKLESIDSCCMMMRSETDVRFDDSYGLAFHEDADFCKQLADKGFFVAAAGNASAEHYHRATTNAMGLNLEPESRWRNADLYNSRWKEPAGLDIPGQGEIMERISNIPMPVNPLNPPGYWLEQVHAIFTDEVRTEILKRKFENQEYFALIKILMVADKRDFLRQIETKVENAEFPDSLLQALIRFYYRRNIYSRCRLYLEKSNAVGPIFDLYRLRICVAEKETDNSVELLTNLMKQFPCHPDLYRLAGEIHLISGNEGEAKSFFALANQLNPRIGKEDEEAFEIKY